MRQVLLNILLKRIYIAENWIGIIMSMHLFEVDKELRLLSAYESGGVALRAYARTDKIKSVEGKGWDTIWMVRRHVEASKSHHSTCCTHTDDLPVMAMRVYRNLETALTVSSDHLIGKYQLQVRTRRLIC